MGSWDFSPPNMIVNRPARVTHVNQKLQERSYDNEIFGGRCLQHANKTQSCSIIIGLDFLRQATNRKRRIVSEIALWSDGSLAISRHNKWTERHRHVLHILNSGLPSASTSFQRRLKPANDLGTCENGIEIRCFSIGQKKHGSTEAQGGYQQHIDQLSHTVPSRQYMNLSAWLKDS